MYRCNCGELYAEHLGPMGCPKCGPRQEGPARIDSPPAAATDALRALVNTARRPEQPGRYVAWVGSHPPTVLLWRPDLDMDWIWAPVVAWIGPLPEVHA